MCKTLTEAGAIVNQPTSLYYGYTPLMFAAEAGHVACVEVLLQTGASVKTCSDSIDKLPQTGVDVNMGSDSDMLLQTGADVNTRNNSGDTALMMAAAEGHDQCIMALLRAGADVNLKNQKNETPLDLARSQKHETCVKLLENHSAVQSQK